ncbi:transmembrane glucosamine N-acetyltransferase NagX [Colwelliaceae bacterium 6441]
MSETLDTTTIKTNKKTRLLSIDALRGFDMFWILGGEKLFAAFFIITGWSFFQIGAEQMEHSAWHGFTAYDLIFPLFIFLSGVSLGIAAKPLSSYPADKAKSLVRHGYKRLFLLILLGILYNHGWGAGIPASPDDIRYVSVLGRIGFSWFVAAMLVWYVSERTQWIVALAILLVYWLMLQFVTLGGVGGGNFTAEGALNIWFDQTLLPGITYHNLPLDPEGLLSNVTSIVNALAGVFAGRFMIKHMHNAKYLISRLLLVGIAVVIIGYIWGMYFPINKTLWTSTFVLVTVGYSILLLTLFYTLIDVLGSTRWAKFFAVIGTNSIIVYIGTSLIDWKYTSKSFFGGLLNIAPAGWDDVILFGGMLILQWCILYWLYCRKIFIKV